MEEDRPDRSAGGEGPNLLRAKYLDYCSAQLAEILLYLTPDEIYTLAQRAARESNDPGANTYDRMVQVAMRWLSRKVVLPPYEVWVEDYQAHPDRYEEYFMGLWESRAPAANEA